MIKLRHSRKKSLQSFKEYGFPIEVYYFIKNNPEKNLPEELVNPGGNLANFIRVNYYTYNKYNSEYPFGRLKNYLFTARAGLIGDREFALLEEIIKNLKIDTERGILECYEENTL